MRHAMSFVAVVLMVAWLAPAGLALTEQERLDILWDRADRQMAFGKYDDALAAGERAVEIAPASSSAWALRTLTRWYHPRARYSQVMESAQRAVELDPNSGVAHYAMGLALWGAADIGRASDEMQKAVRLDPTLARAWSWWGVMEAENGDPEGSLTPLREAVRLEPDNYQWHHALAIGLNWNNDLPAAIEEYRIAADTAESPRIEALARNGFAWSIAQMGATDPSLQQEAFENARRAVEIAPDDSDNVDTLGTLEAMFGDPVAAEHTLRRAIALAGNDVSVPTLAYALALQRKDGDARDALHRISGLLIGDEAEPDNLYFAGMAWDELGEPAITRRIFTRGVERWPDDDWSKQMQGWLDQH